jgi:hypothetical protein
MATWYHNITQKKFNIKCTIDLIESLKKGNLLMKSEDGCAILEYVSNEELLELKKELKEYYEE